MSKYLFILPNFKIGGAERVVQMLLSDFRNANIEYDLFFLSNSGNQESWNTFKFKVLAKNQFRGFISLFNKKLIYQYSFTTHFYINYFIALLRILNKIEIHKVIFRESTPFFSRYGVIKKCFIRIFHSIFYKYSDKIVFQSTLMLDDFNKNVYSCNHIAKIVLYNPLDFQNIDSLLKRTIFHEDIVPHNEYWVSMGRFIPEKGFDLLIKAYSKYYNDKFLPLLIYGDGPEFVYLNSLIQRYKLSEKIFLLKYTSNPFIVLKNANGCILSSRIEGFPNTLNEMIYLNQNILSTICVPEISKIEFINVCLPNNIDSLGLSLSYLFSKRLLTNDGCCKRNSYLSKLNVENYRIKLFEN